MKFGTRMKQTLNSGGTFPQTISQNFHGKDLVQMSSESKITKHIWK